MPACDVIVLGGSAGSIPVLVQLFERLPRDLPAAVFVVVHVAAEAPGLLPEVLARRSRLDVAHAEDGEPVRHGHIRIAPPDQHLLLADGHVRTTRGPRENRFRPAVDVLFRSAAASFGPRVAAVVLSGLLDDGAHGLMAVKRGGGVAIVQDTDEAAFPSMPLAAMRSVDVDHVASVAQLAPLLTRLAHGEPARETHMAKPGGAKKGTNGAAHDPPLTRWDAARADERKNGRPSPYGCPSCGGTLWELDDAGLLRFRCRVGHGFTDGGLLEEQDARLEDALWTAIRALEEAAALRRRVASRVAERGMDLVAKLYVERAAEAEARADTIRAIVERSTGSGREPSAAAGTAARERRVASRRRTKRASHAPRPRRSTRR